MDINVKSPSRTWLALKGSADHVAIDPGDGVRRGDPPLVSSAVALTTDELVARRRAAGYTQIRQVRSGKITSYRAVISGKEISLLVDSFGKFIELP